MGSRETSLKMTMMKLTKRQQAILAGTILGDARLQKTGSKNARLRFEHGGKQKEYLLWKGKQFPQLFNSSPSYVERMHPKTQRTYTYWRWQSHATPELGTWYRLFYHDSVKRIPGTIAELLHEPIGLAVWYMDDGYFDPKQKHSFIYLGCITHTEANRACKMIEKNFNIEPRVYNKKAKGFALFFSVKETKKLHALIRTYVQESMHYKLSLTP